MSNAKVMTMIKFQRRKVQNLKYLVLQRSFTKFAKYYESIFIIYIMIIYIHIILYIYISLLLFGMLPVNLATGKIS